MITTPKPVHFLLLFYVCLKTLVLAQDENQFIYNGFQGANLHLDGLAQIHPNGLLQLTNTSEKQSGHAFYQLPIKFNDSLPQTLSFSTNFVFIMVPENTANGHGIAFSISPSTNFTGAFTTYFLGLLNSTNNGLASNHLLAIELDTNKNEQFNDIDNNHVGIDVNDLTSIDSVTASYYSSREGKNKTLQLISGNPKQVWIDYDGVKNLLNVTLAPIPSPKPNRPLLSTSIDLSPILLDSMYVGFSSSTGEAATNHYILGWSFNKSGTSKSIEISKLPSLPQQRKSRGKQVIAIIVSPVTLSIMLIFTIIVIVCRVRRKKYEDIQEDWEQEYGTQRFSYKDLYKATKEMVLIDWVIENWKQGTILEASDPRLRGEYLKEEMELVLKLGLFCSHPNVAVRPSMRQVVQYLDGDALFPNDILLDIAGIGTLGVRNEVSPEFVM
ncbi:L-type lectin-domain containing receptor kinase I.8 [Camellia lanceoleosa]|uniref:L-type lectin-domain containing receptor kinase I.8 n=1 Tax=Camellia lanceoleosa TaxID=1840588 RepID=A0ACC0HU94_9ERIC|nr:L-type lectin-domain containing receptor kinase I.8 [Camellia lanceoleosa]